MTEDRFGKVNQLLASINPRSVAWYFNHGDEPLHVLQAFWEKVDAFAKALELYLRLEVPWDSKVIDVVGKVQDRKFKTKQLSCDDSVMDRARDLFLFTEGIYEAQQTAFENE